MAPQPTPPPAAHAGVKRPHSSSTASGQVPHKKRRVHHALHHVQNRPKDIEPAPQDPVFAQGQLMKSIGAALVMAGFDSAKHSALEMFRAEVEEYMLHFLTQARISMQGGRRTKPAALDFASALAQMPNAHTASLLKPQLNLELPDDISCPRIPDPDPAPPSAPNFSTLLEPLITSNPPPYIPNHFPALPPEHAWKQTPVYPEREKDARKMREKATQEGMLAEQALRKLAAAAKTGAMNVEKRRSGVLSGEGKARGPKHVHRPHRKEHEDTFADVLKDIGGSDEAMDLGLDEETETAKDGMDLGMPEGVAVNYDMSHWRHGAARRAARA